MRSLLYVPANSERFVAKSADIGAVVIILDLEDGVSEVQKDNARQTLTEAVRVCATGSSQIFVRINGGTERERADVEAVCRAGAHGIFLPKARNAQHVRQLVEALENHEAQSRCAAPLKLIVAIETADALFEARDIARASDRIVGLNCGSEDIATALGASPTPQTLHFPKMMVHVAARAAGVMSLGMLRSVADYMDLAGITAAAKEAKEYGFDGSTCVHPSAVPILNQAFLPSAKEMAWARRLLDAARGREATGQGAFAFEGRMVDRPVFRRAQIIVSRVGS